MKDSKELQKKIKNLIAFGKNAKIKMALNKSLRTYEFLSSWFGQPKESGPIENINAAVESYVNKLIEKAKENEREEQTITGTSTSSNPEQSNRPAEEARSSGEGTPIPDLEPEQTSCFNPKFLDQKATLTTQASHGCDQLSVAKKLFDDIKYRGFQGQLLLAQAGSGKTYILGSVIKNFLAAGLADECLTPWPVLYVTKASVVEQTREVLREMFGLDTINTVTVINIEMLRGALLDKLIDCEMKVINGEPTEVYSWRRSFRPALIIWDESQGLAREESTQTKIANALYEGEKTALWKTYEIDASATPASRVYEFKHFALSTHKTISIAGVGETIISPDNWHMFARIIASPSDPREHNTAAVGRFVDEFEDYIKRIKNVRPKHKAFNSVQKISFQTEEEREKYNKALEKHYERQAKIESDESMTSQQQFFAKLAEFTIFRKAAEECKVGYLTKYIVDAWDKGFAPAVGFSFKQTGTLIVKKLITEYSWTRKDISIIWGGSQESLNLKKKLAKKIKASAALQELLEESDIDIENDLGIYLEDLKEKTLADLEFEKEHDLLSQKPEQREYERQKFQQQISRCCLFSYKSGGVGLSLHHELPQARPRCGVFTPVYSEKELVQALGRLPRLTSLTDTYQLMCYYGGTIEDHVANKVTQKLKCLREVVRARESWEDIIIGEKKDKPPVVEEIEESDHDGVGILSEYVEEKS